MPRFTTRPNPDARGTVAVLDTLQRRVVATCGTDLEAAALARALNQRAGSPGHHRARRLVGYLPGRRSA